MITHIKILLLVIVLTLISTIPSYAWLRPSYEDAQVVDRSELIVVGRLIPESIYYVKNESKSGEGSSGEVYATLVITEVLKGKTDNLHIPVIIYFGMTPIAGFYTDKGEWRNVQRENFMFYANDTIGILDTGNSAFSPEPFIKNVEKENLWFLRKRSGLYGWKPGNGDYGIVDPEDLQPLNLKSYFQCYLSDDPETALQKYILKHPDMIQRTKKYLDNLHNQHIIKSSDSH